jgi:hypothetical protein
MQQKSHPSLYDYFDDDIAQTRAEAITIGLGLLVEQCHVASYNRGWWHDPVTGLSLIPGDDSTSEEYPLLDELAEMRKAWFPYVIATKIALIHAEVSEGLEAYRTDARDDKIDFPGITAEMGDAVIRIADLMGCLKYAAAYNLIDPHARPNDYEVGAAILEKLPVNATRADHDLGKRAKPGGKKF